MVLHTYLGLRKSGFRFLPGCELQGLLWAIHEMSTVPVDLDVWLVELSDWKLFVLQVP